MKNRSLAAPIQDLCFARHKIAFVSGPRQCGKTTLAKMMMRGRPVTAYENWDSLPFQRRWATDPASVVPTSDGKTIPLLILDEIHKHYRWKRHLKGVYDTLASPCDILVTGSAKLNIYRRHSDSMVGRFLHFRMHPLSIREMEQPKTLSPDELLGAIFSGALQPRKVRQDHLAAMMEFGPFPEPLLEQDARAARLWRRNRNQLVIREDLRDISRLPELGELEMMAALLPQRVGSLFSLTSIGEDLRRPIPTVKRWLDYLKEVYFAFEIKPYSRHISRSLRKEGKLYLWDFGGIQDQPARFENLVAAHLLKACHFWTDTGLGEFDLFFLRNKEQQEIDFLIVRDGEPWLPVEVKQRDTEPSPSWRKFAPMLPCKHGLQIVQTPEWKVHTYCDSRVLVAGAAEALNYFV